MKLDLRFKVGVILLVVGALYFLTRSPGLDEWDSVQFAMGVRDFDLWKNQPHPPGYPLYILCGWLGDHLLGWDPNFSLHVGSCLGGAAFVVAWFLIVRMYFGERFAWLLSVTLAITPVVWMTSTKVLSDSLAAGLFAITLYYSLVFQREKRLRALLLSSIWGAASVGVRPQMIAVVIVVLALPLLRTRASARLCLMSGATFLMACLMWFVPLCYTQSNLPGNVPHGWLAYPAQVYRQWHWRLDRPDVFVGAGNFSASYLALRFTTHILGWFGVGLGFLYAHYALVIGGLLVLAGIVVTFRKTAAEDFDFWKSQWIWSVLYVLIIFCCLPADQRYYLPVMPLLLVALLLGLARLSTPWSVSAYFLPALLLSVSIPCAIANHCDDAPPVRAVRFLQSKFLPRDRGNVLLFLTHSQRHFEWYGPQFDAIVDRPFSGVAPERLSTAKAIYTEDPKLSLPAGWQLVPLVEFKRSVVIYRKHHDVQLFQVEKAR